MPRLKVPITLQTAFAEYTLDEQIGEGGAGRVYGGVDLSGSRVAVKVLIQTSKDKKQRFKNETAFLIVNRHPNIVTVTDYGMATGNVKGPFYVMRRYSGNLRALIGALNPTETMQVFSRILDGVEAAHLQNVVHRDLKPENVLFDRDNLQVAIADFGIASFTDSLKVTLVDTKPAQRLANFQYAAPEQRFPGDAVSFAADIYALGLMLNELFTTHVPHGTDYRLVSTVSGEFGFLDLIVEQMIRQDPAERPASIADVKRLILRHHQDAVSLQRLSSISSTVIPAGEVDEPLAHDPPLLLGANYANGRLYLTLDRPVTDDWINALRNMGGSYHSIHGAEPHAFQFDGTVASVRLSAQHPAGTFQLIIDYFKSWLPRATAVLKRNLERQIEQEQAAEREKLRQQRDEETQRQLINRGLKV